MIHVECSRQPVSFVPSSTVGEANEMCNNILRNGMVFFRQFRSYGVLPNNLTALFKIVPGEIEIKIIENSRKVLRIVIRDMRSKKL